MQPNLYFIWDKIRSGTVNYHKVVDEWPGDLIRNHHTFENYKKGQAAKMQWVEKIRHRGLEIWAWLTLLFIELDDFCKDYLVKGSTDNFSLREKSTVHMKVKDKATGIRSEQEVEITKIEEAIKFFRHACCHPEKKSRLRIDPAITRNLNESSQNLDSSYHSAIVEKNNGDVYLKIGGGKLYFSDLDRLIVFTKKA